MSEMVAYDVADLRDGEALLATVLELVQRHSDRPLLIADVDRDLELDLGLRSRQRFELAGELAELAQLPGAEDDTVNSCVIETLALGRTPRALALNVAAVRIDSLSPRHLHLHPVPVARAVAVDAVKRTA